MKPETVMDLLDAGILARHVEADAFPQMSGIMLVKPPGNLGTTFIKAAAQPHSDALIVSDLTLPAFKIMRDDFISGRYSVLSLLEVDKLYSRQQSTAMNLEGLIKALAEEGFRHFATEDQRMPSLEARAHIQGSMTLSLLRRHNERWRENGFSRRFLWVTFALADAQKITKAVREWKLIEMGQITSKRPVNNRIPYKMEDGESRFLEMLVKDQPGGNATAYVLLKKIFCVLRWKYPVRNGSPDRAMEIMKDLAPALTQDGGKLII